MPQVDIRIKSTADNSGFDSASNASKALGKSLSGAAAGARGMASGISEAEIKASSGKDVIEGLATASKGGEGAFFGLSKAAGSFFTILNSSPVMRLISVGGLLLAGMKLLTDKVVESSKAWEEHDKKIKPIKEEYKKIGEAAKLSLDEQLKRIGKLTTAYDDFTKAAARSRKEVEQMNNAQQKLDIARIDKEEESVLRTAKTEKERDEIKQKYDDNRLQVRNKYEDIASENERLSAQLQIRESEEQIRKVQTERDRVDSALRDKQAEFELALSKSRALLESGASPTEVSASVRESLLAQRARDDAAKAKSDFEEKARIQEEKAYEDERAARATLDVNKVETETTRQTRQTRQTKSKQQDAERAPSKDEIDALGKEAEEAAARGDWAAQDAAVAKRRALLSAGRKPSPVTTYAPRTAAEKAGQQPGPDQPAAAGQPDQLPDLAGPLNEAAQKAGDSATQSADSIAAAAEAAKAVADNTKPLDASGLTAALQSAATAQQTASTQTAAGMQQLVNLSQQQVTIAQQQSSEMAKLHSQVENLRQRLNQLAQRAA